MGQTGLYLGGQCPPNMEAYLDARFQESDLVGADLIVLADCSLPDWITRDERVSVWRSAVRSGTGISMTLSAARATREYLSTCAPDTVKQITQARWHAPGVLLGALGSDTSIHTRASASMFCEYKNDSSTIRSYILNNILGRAIFLADKIYTPKYGPVLVPWWSSTRRVIEPRKVNEERFFPETPSKDDLFSSDVPRVLTVGRVSKQKGIDMIPRVSELLPDWEFVVVGPARDAAILKELQDRPNVTHHDAIDYVEMPGVYTAADVLLSTSRIEWGGISRAMLEGSACGLPIVALDLDDADQVAEYTVGESPEEIVEALSESLGHSHGDSSSIGTQSNSDAS